MKIKSLIAILFLALSGIVIDSKVYANDPTELTEEVPEEQATIETEVNETAVNENQEESVTTETSDDSEEESVETEMSDDSEEEEELLRPELGTEYEDESESEAETQDWQIEDDSDNDEDYGDDDSWLDDEDDE